VPDKPIAAINQTKSVGMAVKKLEPLCTRNEKVKRHSHCGTQLLPLLKKLKMELQHEQQFHLWHILKELKAGTLGVVCPPCS
jgi:hypothetical protein